MCQQEMALGWSIMADSPLTADTVGLMESVASTFLFSCSVMGTVTGKGKINPISELDIAQAHFWRKGSISHL